MQVALVLLILAALAVAAVAYVVVAASRRAMGVVHAVAHESGRHVLYRVPQGQDPAAVVAALHGHGFDAVSEPGPRGVDVAVPCRADDPDVRERVRAVIAVPVPGNLEGDPAPAGRVRFADE
ncbi:hypothetical protein EKO23_21580 [Nocardioides guangzhouensis]|uniref:Uncharacterized protein n=1 Tax=Nocardioides guangzhouensis TaxID=2497878 RepID=A0A4Q4Z433_9ACTN|nr:hypothetical protein [Nocardioides guangzhouensis]RYP82470.1 hypothetical protein EKO23_21580 [Nocardioides guangzhouensis]